MKTDYDVIIIGAGPAGASCAKHLVENGLKVLVIEKEKLPRRKCCSSLLSTRAMDFIKENYGKVPEDIICKNSNIKTKITKNNRVYFEVPNYNCLNVERGKFDNWLIQQSNAKIMNSKVINYIQDGDAYNIVSENNQSIKSKYVIFATGSNLGSTKIFNKNTNKNKYLFAEQYIYSGLFDFDDSNIYMSFSNQFSDKGFSWYFKKNSLSYIGIGWNKYNGNYKKWFNYLKEKFKFDLELMHNEYSFIPYYNDVEYFFGQSNLLVTGEASGLISKSYEGITSALISGKISAESVIRANKENKNANDIYLDQIQKEVDYLRGKK